MDYESCRDFLKRLGYVILICIAFHFKLDNFAFMIAFIFVIIVLFCFSYYKAKQQKADQEMDRIMNAPSETVSTEVLPLNNNNMEEKQALTTEEKRLQKIAQLKARLQKEEAKLNQSQRKARTKRLIEIGGVVENVLGSPIEKKDLQKLIDFLKQQEERGQFFSKAMGKSPLP